MNTFDLNKIVRVPCTRCNSLKVEFIGWEFETNKLLLLCVQCGCLFVSTLGSLPQTKSEKSKDKNSLLGVG